MIQKVRKKRCFNAHFQYSQSKIMGLNKMWSLKEHQQKTLSYLVDFGR